MKSIKYALLGLVGVIGMLVSMFGPVKVPFAEALAKSYYRYALGALLLIVLLVSFAVGLFILTFDANNFKSEIVQFVKARTQRDLVLEGNIKVTFFPKLGLDSGRASLSQRNSAREFASINNARLYIAWLPLFRNQLVFDHMEIDGARANLTRLKDGSTNFDDLLISDEHLAPLTFDIDSVRVTDSAINWQDEMESQRFSLHNLQVETGRLADRVSSQLTASFRLDSEMAHLNADVRLKSRLFFDRMAGRYEFADIAGQLEGAAAGINDLKVNFDGSLDSYPAQGSLAVDNFMATATGKRGQRELALKVAVTSLKISDHAYAGNLFTLDASSTYLDETVKAAVRLPAFEIADRVFKAAGFTADVDYSNTGGALQGKLASPVRLSFGTAPKLQLDALTFSLASRHPALAGEVVANATGNMQADFSGQSVRLGFRAKIDDSKINGTATLKDFSHPVYTFDISANRLDLDRYISSGWIRRFVDDAAPFAPIGLKDVTLHGNLRAGEVVMAKIKASKLTAGISIEQSTLKVAPLAARLYGGALSGSISVAAQDVPQISVRQNLKGFQMSELLAETTSAGKLSGRGDLALDISATGGSIGALRKKLDGRASLALSRGSLAGIDLRAALLEGKGDLGTGNAARIRDAKFSDKTGFSQLQATFNFRDGSTLGNSFDMISPLIRTVGEGNVDPGSGNISYRLEATVSSAINRRIAGELAEFRGVTVPIRVSGPYATPSFALDFGAASGGNIARSSAAKAATPAQASTAKAKTRATVPAKK